MNKFRTVVSVIIMISCRIVPWGLAQQCYWWMYPWRFDFCVTPRSKKEIAEYLGMASVSYCIKRYVDPLVEDGALALTEPKSKRSHTQKYFTVK